MHQGLKNSSERNIAKEFSLALFPPNTQKLSSLLNETTTVTDIPYYSRVSALNVAVSLYDLDLIKQIFKEKIKFPIHKIEDHDLGDAVAKAIECNQMEAFDLLLSFAEAENQNDVWIYNALLRASSSDTLNLDRINRLIQNVKSTLQLTNISTLCSLFKAQSNQVASLVQKRMEQLNPIVNLNQTSAPIIPKYRNKIRSSEIRELVEEASRFITQPLPAKRLR